MGAQGGYATNFGAGLTGGGRGVEGQIMMIVFKTLVTRLVKSNKELKISDNMVRICTLHFVFSQNILLPQCKNGPFSGEQPWPVKGIFLEHTI